MDRSKIEVSELRRQTYGPSTAAAVLAFKQKRKIINPAYQKTADNIVGKMTIARLDKELLAADQAPSSNHVVCSTTGGSVAGARSIAEPLVGKPSTPRENAVLRILIQQTEGAAQVGGAVRAIFDHFQRAAEIMAVHGLRFPEGQLLDFVGPSVPDFERIIPGSQASCFSVREAAERVLPGRADTVRIIYCPFVDNAGARGVTDGGTCAGVTFPKFCLISVNPLQFNPPTMLHEMIHAAKPIFLEHDKDPNSVFSEALDSKVLPNVHAKSLADSFFARRL